VGPSQERPADLNLASFLVVAVEPRKSDYPLIVDINGDQGPPGRQGLVKESPEDRLFMAVFHRMLFPNQRISGDRVQVIKVST